MQIIRIQAMSIQRMRGMFIDCIAEMRYSRALEVLSELLFL